MRFAVDPDSLVPPRPKVTSTSRPYWDALAEHRLVIQRCGACGAWVHYPRLRCTSCGREALAFEDVDTTATLYSFTVARQATAPHFRDQVPQVIAIVELVNGVHLTATLLDTDGTGLSAGTPLEPVYVTGDDGLTMLHYRPVPAG